MTVTQMSDDRLMAARSDTELRASAYPLGAPESDALFEAAGRFEAELMEREAAMDELAVDLEMERFWEFPQGAELVDVLSGIATIGGVR